MAEIKIIKTKIQTKNTKTASKRKSLHASVLSGFLSSGLTKNGKKMSRKICTSFLCLLLLVAITAATIGLSSGSRRSLTIQKKNKNKPKNN